MNGISGLNPPPLSFARRNRHGARRQSRQSYPIQLRAHDRRQFVLMHAVLHNRWWRCKGREVMLAKRGAQNEKKNSIVGTAVHSRSLRSAGKNNVGPGWLSFWAWNVASFGEKAREERGGARARLGGLRAPPLARTGSRRHDRTTQHELR